MYSMLGIGIRIAKLPVSFAVLGALLGTQEGRKVEIVNTFELAVEEDGKTVDAGFLITRREQCRFTSTMGKERRVDRSVQTNRYSPLWSS